MSDAWERFGALPKWVRIVLWVLVWPLPLFLLALRNPPSQRGFFRTLAAVGSIAWLGTAVALAGGDTGNNGAAETSLPVQTTEQESTTTSQATTTSANPDEAPDATDLEPPSTAEPDGDYIDELLAALDALRIGPEWPEGYDRALFPHWDDVNGDGCDTRCEVLAAQRLPDGAWFSEWDGATVVDSSEVHIDHIVALAEAWRSGAHAWTPEQRDDFADDKDNLIAVSASSNLRKSSRDAAEWFPSRHQANCLWASTVVRVKTKWDLAVDPAERDALGNLLRTCER